MACPVLSELNAPGIELHATLVLKTAILFEYGIYYGYTYVIFDAMAYGLVA